MSHHTIFPEIEKIWNTFYGKKIFSIKHEVENAIQKVIAEGYKLNICIGTDSQVKGDIVEFATVIAFIRKGKGGFMYKYHDKLPNTMSIHERMITETARSIEVAADLCDLFEKYSIELEVHADINTSPNFKSNIAFQEATGYILGMGFAFKAKPDAFAASSCGDKAVRS